MTEINLEKALNKQPSLLEQKILKAVFKRNDIISEIYDIVNVDNFTISDYANIYNAMLSLYKNNDNINCESVQLWLENNGIFVDPNIIKKLYNESYTSLKVKETALILKELHNRRYMLEKIRNILEKQEESPTTSVNILEQINNTAISASEKISCNDSATRCFEDKNRILNELQKRLDNPFEEQGLVTGWKTIDSELGGFYRGDLICLCASSGAGKSWISLETAVNMALHKPDLKILYFSLEMKRNQCEDRMLSIVTDIPTEAILRPRHYFKKFDEDGILRDIYLEQPENKQIKEFKEKIKNGVDILSSLNITIDDEGGLKIKDILARINRYVLKNGGVDAIFIDHTYLLRNIEDGDLGTSDEFGAIYYALKNVAKKHNCICYALHQLNMEVKNNSDRRPSIYNIRGSSQIIDNCDVLMLLYNANIHKDLIRQNPELKDVIDITFGKTRNSRIPDDIQLKYCNRGFIEKEPNEMQGEIVSGNIFITEDGEIVDEE